MTTLAVTPEAPSDVTGLIRYIQTNTPGVTVTAAQAPSEWVNAYNIIMVQAGLSNRITTWDASNWLGFIQKLNNDINVNVGTGLLGFGNPHNSAWIAVIPF